MNLDPQTVENQASADHVSADKAALDLQAGQASQLPDAANNNDEQVEDPAEVYFAHG